MDPLTAALTRGATFSPTEIAAVVTMTSGVAVLAAILAAGLVAHLLTRGR